MVATNVAKGTFLSTRPGLSRPDGDMVEWTLFLPRQQALALEAAAHDRGLTVGQLLRRLIHDFADHEQANCADDWLSGADAGRWV
jgi:hypothetical protein